MNLCILDLAEITGGELRFAAMPPCHGDLARIGHIRIAAIDVTARDVYWSLLSGAGEIELAFLRGALGVVAAGRSIDPWPGCFSLTIEDPFADLAKVTDRLRPSPIAARSLKKEVSLLPDPQSGAKTTELKVLQLCRARGADIYPPTCERPAYRAGRRGCRRHAA